MHRTTSPQNTDFEPIVDMYPTLTGVDWSHASREIYIFGRCDSQNASRRPSLTLNRAFRRVVERQLPSPLSLYTTPNRQVLWLTNFTACRALSDYVLDVHHRRKTEDDRRSRLKLCPGSSTSALQFISTIHTAMPFALCTTPLLCQPASLTVQSNHIDRESSDSFVVPKSRTLRGLQEVAAARVPLSREQPSSSHQRLVKCRRLHFSVIPLRCLSCQF